MVKHHQLIYKNKYLALMATYRLAEETPQFKGAPVIQGNTCAMFSIMISGGMRLCYICNLMYVVASWSQW